MYKRAVCSRSKHARCIDKRKCLRRRVRGLNRLRAALDLDVLDGLGAALELGGLDRLGATYSPVAFDPEAIWH